jgi:predicted  nucleic acid-binding Zn-ribbon protein
MPAVVISGMGGQLLLAVDNWVHKNKSDSTTLAADHHRLEEEVKTVCADLMRLETTIITARERADRVQARLDEAESLRVERAERIHSELKRLDATTAQNHAKAMSRYEDLDGLLNVWTRRVVAIEIWIDRPVRAKEEGKQ